MSAAVRSNSWAASMSSSHLPWLTIDDSAFCEGGVGMLSLASGVNTGARAQADGLQRLETWGGSAVASRRGWCGILVGVVGGVHRRDAVALRRRHRLRACPFTAHESAAN